MLSSQRADLTFLDSFMKKRKWKEEGVVALSGFLLSPRSLARHSHTIFLQQILIIKFLLLLSGSRVQGFLITEVHFPG